MASVYGEMTLERKVRIWQLWRQGRPMSEIATDIESGTNENTNGLLRQYLPKGSGHAMYAKK